MVRVYSVVCFGMTQIAWWCPIIIQIKYGCVSTGLV